MMPRQWDVEASCMVQRTFEFGSCPRRCGGWGHPGHPGGSVWYFAMSWRFEQNLSTLNFWVLGLQWLHILKPSLSVSSLRLRLILLRSSAVDSWIVPRDPQLLNRQLQASCQFTPFKTVVSLSASTVHMFQTVFQARVARANKLYPLEKRRVSLCPIWKLHVDKTRVVSVKAEAAPKKDAWPELPRGLKFFESSPAVWGIHKQIPEPFATRYLKRKQCIRCQTVKQSHVTSEIPMRIKDFQTGFCLDLLPLSTTFTGRNTSFFQNGTCRLKRWKHWDSSLWSSCLGSGRPNNSVVWNPTRNNWNVYVYIYI